MYVGSVNHPREDSVFSGKVKSAIQANDGSLVPALEDFEARHAKAVAAGAKGMSYAEFLAYLGDHGVHGLSAFETQYLCNSFDDGVAPRKHNVISAATFTRHLAGLNHRRMQAVLQAWESVREATGAPDQANTVAAAGLLSTFRTATTSLKSQLAWGATHREAQLEGTFRVSASGGSGMASTGASADDAEATEVSRAAFVAFYAGLSPHYGSDEAFVVMVLKEWAADKAQQPKLQETQRTWNEAGDPLAIEGTHYVRDALNMSLGVSSKSYDASHLARTPAYVQPLAPLDRADLMESMSQRMYKPYDDKARTLADPLATRRGQLM